MTESSKDQEVIAALLERMKTQRLPRARDLKAKVDRGELLDEHDVGFLTQVIEDSHAARTLLARHPEYQELAANMINLYNEITTKALENEKAAP